MPGLGLDLASLGGRRVFSPAALFRAGEIGLWYDPSDLASVFQDAAGAVAGAVDAPVGLIRDKSGRGNDLAQTVAAARPMLRRDGNGRSYLEFDGGGAFVTAAAASFAFTQAFALALAMRFEGGASFTALAGTYAVSAGWDVGLQGGVPRATARGSATIDTGLAGFPDMTGADATLFVEMSRDAITRSVDGVRVTTAGTWTPASGQAAFALGQRGNDSSSRFKGRVYRLIVLGRAMTIAERGLMAAWLGERG